MSDRADRVAAVVRERELDALLVTDQHNLRWLTGFTGSNGLALVGVDGSSRSELPMDGEAVHGLRRFITDFRYLTQIAEQLDAVWEREISSELPEQLAKGLPAGPFRLGFDDANMSVKAHAHLAELVAEGVELVAAGGAVEDLRAIKDADEIAAIRKAAVLADEAFEEVVGAGIVGRTEADVALDLEMAMRLRGAQAVSFPPIVAAAEHGALPHAAPRDVPIPASTLVVIDWGAHLDGYASDCTRTVATGELDARHREIYDVVLEAQEAALAAVKPGPLGKDVDAVARTIIDAAGHAEHFGHGLGHGVGLEVHEGPRLSKQGKTPLAAGHIVTVEPGVYVPGAVGVRIEDLVAVTDDGYENLSGLSKTLRIVD